MLRLIKMTINHSLGLHFYFSGRVPGHAIDEGGRPRIFLDLRQLRKKSAIAIGDAVQPLQRFPIVRFMIDASPLSQLHGAQPIVQVSCMTDMDHKSHALPAAQLMIELRIGPAQAARMADHALFFERHPAVVLPNLER